MAFDYRPPKEFLGKFSAVEINRVRAENDHEAKHGEYHLGLVQFSVGIDLAVTMGVEDDGSGAYCTYVDKVSATLDYRKYELYVARELPPGSCLYQAVLGHEQRHLRFHREMTGLAEDMARRAILSEAERIGIIPTRAPEAVRDEIENALLDRLLVQMEAYVEKLNARNRTIDTEKEYDKVVGSCGNRGREWLQSALTKMYYDQYPPARREPN